MSALPKSFAQKDPRQDYGLSMRFRVTVHTGTGLPVQLGKWSGCSGLGLTVKFDEYVPGGQFEGSRRFPDRVTYGQVTVERAMHAESSSALQTWLQNVIREWVAADDGGAKDKVGNAITIEMLSATDWRPIYKWELRDAIPVSWTGPSLSAKANDVATEKLVLAHNGVTGSRPGLATPATVPVGNGMTGKDGVLRITLLASTDANERMQDFIDFQYNPQKVTLSKQAQFRATGVVTTETREQQAIDPGQLAITFSDLRVEGVQKVQTTVAKLYSWLKVENAPAGAATAGAGGDEPKQVVKHVRVVMGAAGMAPSSVVRPGVNYRALLKSVNVTYTRFTRAGLPNRATITVTLQEVVPPKPGTNPSSGTRDAGRAHTVIAGDSLPSIAKETYGSPAAWRRIAEENRIDDPLRLRNGSALLLPGVG